ncbi:hypothetical protein BDV18DRAFT_66598 [Aspergillus unguis]
MPPKKSTAKRNKPTAAATASPRSTRLSPGIGGGYLPNIPTKQSFAYGSSDTPILPHMLAAKPQMNIAEMAESIEGAVQVAKDREISESISNSPRRSPRRSPTASPPVRNRREPTPDQVQLLNALNEASSATPSTPVRHSLSSRNSTPPREVTAQYVYPPEMHQTPVQPQPLASNILEGDSSSIISYNVERQVHDDDLKRAHSNIAAPPRRFNGGFGYDPIEEEEEDEDEPYSFRQPSPVPQPFIPDPPIRDYDDDGEGFFTQNYLRRKDSLVSKVLQAFVGLLVIYAFYMMIMDAPIPDYKTPIRFNNSNLDALSSQVSALGLQVNSLTKDMKSVRAEVSRIPAPTTIFQYPNKGRQHPQKTNFLSVGHGVIIDPYITSPSAGRKLTWWQEFYMWLAGDKHLRPQPPLSALTSWEDFGECWCSAPRKGMSQLGIVLGQRIIPEDVIVEHLPKSATIRPGVAPQEMELWARYRYVKGPRPYRWSLTSWFRGYPESIIGQDDLAPDRRVVRPPVMEALRLAWRGEPDSAFSNDKLLGEDFYRIGKWTYDINEQNHIQTFPVTAYIDSDELRVDKVVFRVLSNWGGNETCIYRLKLQGKL